MNILYERILLIMFIIVFLIVMWCMYDNYYVYSHTINKSVLKYKPGQPYSVSPEESPILDEMAAWITIDGTNIDYPVMQAADNIKYLNTDPFGEYSLSGSIFLDCRNSPDLTDDYSIIYGHHMEYGVMFGALDDFLNEKYLASHRTGTLIIGKNAEKIYDIEVFASMRADAADKTVFDTASENVDAYIQNNADICLDDRSDRIIGLSTCAEDGASSRIIVFCYILEE